MLKRITTGVCFAALLCGCLAGPAFGAGFGIFEQGAKGMGMAGAFTAQADDPSALFHNAAGIAFQDGGFMVGTTLISLGDSTFKGYDPYPGSDARGNQKDQILFPSHVYYVRPLTPEWVFGFGFNTPFGLTTEWENPDSWPGRFLNNRAELRTFDLNPTIGWKVTPNFSLGFGAIARFSDVELERNAGIVNPFTQTFVDVASSKLTSDLESGYGFNIGLLHKYNNSFSWGLSYRSAIQIDYGGKARLTQISTGNAQLDAVVAGLRPFDQNLPITTSIEYPDVASLGVMLALSPTMALEVDVNWTGWSSFDRLDVTFADNEELSFSVPEDWEDCWNYRIGWSWARTASSALRLGFVYDETPQPKESFGPLLPDANRYGYTVGYGLETGRFVFDVALMYLQFADRDTTVNNDNFNGEYQTNAWLLGLSLGF